MRGENHVRTVLRSPVSCSDGLFTELEGHLASPGYPSLVHQALACRYVISVPAGFTVFLNFSDSFYIESVDTEQGPECLHHWLQVMGPAPQSKAKTKKIDLDMTHPSITHAIISVYRCPFPINSRLSCAVTRVQV